MHIQRIQVPDFRALKNVDITFEKEFTPRIFPLGSQNGGGKSTLLQLIFVLLHCAGNPDRVEFIQNLLDGFYIKNNSGERTLATIDIWDGSLNIKIEFFVGNEDYIFNHFIGSKVDNIELMKYYNFYKNQFTAEKILPLQKKKSNIEMVLLNLRHKARKNNQSNSLSTEEQEQEKSIKQEINVIQTEIDKEIALSQKYHNLLNEALKNTQVLYICDCYNESNSTVEKLMCIVDGIDDIHEVGEFLKTISNKIFLTSHISQIFLFLQPDNRKSLFKKQDNNQNNYYQQIKIANSRLLGFFTYDFLAIDILIEAFKKARDEDFKQAVEQGGNYGNNYVKLLAELNNLLSNKKINVQPDLSGINFRIDGDQTELYPEDLSHGELKRLCIYMWLKYNNIKDAIVLMDELEISFHPDWQYQIVRDLEEWGATNQYILATHSYEICQAVTPAHVKELDPKLQARTIQ
ncbi:AAA family ATPase [Anabaena azotica]|uniref:AAA family ATPase n=1 Tax=Anabaena azotica TaxID=197653 RepID=UPI0039A72BD3